METNYVLICKNYEGGMMVIPVKGTEEQVAEAVKHLMLDEEVAEVVVAEVKSVIKKEIVDNETQN
jgi:hypothetical protein